MARYLLGSQCVVDIAKRIQLAPERWFDGAGAKGIDGRDIFISAITPTILSRALRGDSKTAPLRNALEKLIDRFVQLRQVAEVTKGIADKWDEIVDLSLDYVNTKGVTKPYSSLERMVLATAIEGLDGRPFILVERHQPAHDELQAHGLELTDPYAEYP
jgi:hypothetical protein